MHYLCDQLHFAFSRWLYLLQYGLNEIFANAIYTPGIWTLCILWDCRTNCNQLGSVWSQSLLLKHCQHIAHTFQANVLPMFRMQYFCNNVIFATPICNTFLSNKDIWSRIVSKSLLFKFLPHKACAQLCHSSSISARVWIFLKVSFTEKSREMSRWLTRCSSHHSIMGENGARVYFCCWTFCGSRVRESRSPAAPKCHLSSTWLVICRSPELHLLSPIFHLGVTCWATIGCHSYPTIDSVFIGPESDHCQAL